LYHVFGGENDRFGEIRGSTLIDENLYIMGRFSFLWMVVLILLFRFSYGQDWVKTYPAWSNSFAIWLVETNDKGYIFLLTRYINGYALYAFIVKTDINGNQIWVKTIGNGNNTFINRNIEKTLDQGYIVCGATDKYGGQNPDPYLIKLNSCGELEWCSVIQTPGIYDYAIRVRQTPGGDYVLLAAYSDPNEDYRIQLFKLNSNGEWLWKHNYPPDSLISNEDGQDLTILDDGYLITASCYSPDSGQVGGAYERPYYIKTDTSGNDVWRLVYGSGNGYHGFPGYSTLKSFTGNFYSVGWHSNFCDTPALIKCKSNGNEDYFQDLMPSACPGGSGSINFLYDTTIVVLVGGTVNGVMKLKWIKTDTLGIEKFSKEFPSGYMEGTGWTIVTSDKKIVGLSEENLNIYLYKLNSNFDPDSIYTHPYVYDSLCPYPIVSDTINPDCGLLVNAGETYSTPEATQLKIFPNPASEMINVEFPKFLILSSGSGRHVATTTYHHWKSTTLEVYDLNGRRVFLKEIPKSLHELEINVSSWKPGLFYFRLVYDNKTVARKNLVIHR